MVPKWWISFFVTSADDWVDEKKKVDGAEGLWRIHDKLYDLTMWARSHPGGSFWINKTRGTDITEAFENHHFSPKATSVLKNYYKKEATSPRNAESTFSESGFYKKFKRKASQKISAIRPSSGLLSLSDFLAASVFLSGLLGVSHGIIWTIASGFLLGVLCVSCHSFLHMKDNWRVYYLNVSLMSSREWRIRHVLSHHQFRGTASDLEIPVLQPLSKTREGLPKYIFNFCLFPVAAHVQFIRRCLEVILSKKLEFHSEEIVAFSLPFFLYLFNGAHLWTTFVTWNYIIFTGSFVYCFLSSVRDNSHSLINWKSHNLGSFRNETDFGLINLSLCGKHPKCQNFVTSFLDSFRNNSLHYLCPVVECRSLTQLIPVFDEVINDCGISFLESGGGFLDGLQKAAPEGHVFVS